MSVLELVGPEGLRGVEIGRLAGQVEGSAGAKGAHVVSRVKGRKVGRAVSDGLLLEELGARVESIGGVLGDLVEGRGRDT